MSPLRKWAYCPKSDVNKIDILMSYFWPDPPILKNLHLNNYRYHSDGIEHTKPPQLAVLWPEPGKSIDLLYDWVKFRFVQCCAGSGGAVSSSPVTIAPVAGAVFRHFAHFALMVLIWYWSIDTFSLSDQLIAPLAVHGKHVFFPGGAKQTPVSQ